MKVFKFLAVTVLALIFLAGPTSITMSRAATMPTKVGILQVKVKPPNPGTVTVRVWLAQTPGGTPLNETFAVSQSNPLNKTWHLAPALYAVTISWKSGYQNITGAVADNGIIINGKAMYYQVLGTPADANGISATFDARIP
ncbi:MAG: hypothetical protein NTV01_07580 [Bacteroidia bacterium]|nr:hypothetical protein [Bacteroidia bacterium]